MSRRVDVDVMMQVRDRMREMNEEDYAYYMSRRGCSDGGGYGRESERRGRSRSGSRSENVVRERGRVRSRSPPRRYHEVSRKGNVLDVELGYRHRHHSTPPRFQPGETYEPASQMTRPCFTDTCKYGDPSLEAGKSDYVSVNKHKMVVSDDVDVVRESVEDKRMVKPYHGVQPVSSYGDISRHFRSGSANRIMDKRDQHGNYLAMERALDLGVYTEYNHLQCSRDTSSLVPMCSDSPANLYEITSPAARYGFHASSRNQGDPHIKSDDLCSKKSIFSERSSSFTDSYGEHPRHYSTLDHLNNTRSSSGHLKSTYDSIQNLHYHYSTVKSGDKGELGHLSDLEYRNVHSDSSQTHIQRATGLRMEGNRFLSDEDYGALCQNPLKHCYSARLPLTVTNENEDTYTSDCSFKDFQLSHRVSHDRDIHSDSHSCLSHLESLLHGGMDPASKVPHFIAPSDYGSGCMATGTSFDHYSNQEEKTNYANSRANLIYNADVTSDYLSRSRLRSSPSSHNNDEQYYHASILASSTEPRDKYVDSRMHNPDISSKMKLYSAHVDFPSLDKEHCIETLRYRDSERESISTKHCSVYDVNATSEYGMGVGRLDADKQRWVEDDLIFRGAPDGMLETNSVTYNKSGVRNSGRRTSHGRCNAGLSRYVSDRSENLSEEEMVIHPPETIGLDHIRRAGSRSIFDRLGSPKCSTDQFPKRHMPGHFISQKHELRQLKDHNRKSNHLTLKGFPYSSRESSCYNPSGSSNTNLEERHVKLKEDTDTLKDVDLPFNPASHNNDGEFKQSIQKAFLSISLKMNGNPATRMRYKGQGKAGTLFCIVCKRSNSKEFRVTQDLAAHSLTCKKAGLRSQHLGLFKAICVTMGWNSDIDQQSGMWTPQILSEEKALAQKEDLICWPPVFIVHNASLLRKDHATNKILTAEELEAFFRSKSFINGKVKVCLGHSTNNHVMVIKFLGTFPGLKDAEKLHNYFLEKKHGRVEFWKLAKTNVKASQPCGTGSHGDNAELPDLYGYLGIAEDWGKLDTESKKRCTIRSKQEILDISAEPILSCAS